MFERSQSPENAPHGYKVEKEISKGSNLGITYYGNLGSIPHHFSMRFFVDGYIKAGKRRIILRGLTIASCT